MDLHKFFWTIHSVLLQIFTGATESEKSVGDCKFGNITHQCTKMLLRESSCFSTKNFQSRQISNIWNLVFTLPLQILLML